MRTGIGPSSPLDIENGCVMAMSVNPAAVIAS